MAGRQPKATGAAKPKRPRSLEFRDLDQAEIEEMLGRNNVARLAYSFHDRVDIEPIHYVFGDGWLYFRTSPGAKIATLAHHQWVALEIDEIEGLFSWRSVVVHGTVYPADLVGSPLELRGRERALEALRRLIPETFAEGDPVPFRTIVLRVSVTEVRGREAYTPAPPSSRKSAKRARRVAH